MAFLKPTDMDDPLAGYTSLIWRDYPVALGPDSVGLNSADQFTCHTSLWADPSAPHWLPSKMGYRLFTSAGRPSPFLKRIMLSLREQQQMIEHTYTLAGLLHRADSLSPITIAYDQQRHVIYQIETKNLGARLEALDSNHSAQALHMETLLHKTQIWLDCLEEIMSTKGI